jgi:hypothetical protein
MPAHGVDEAAEHERIDREREETLSVATSSLAAVATAWAAFQSAIWNGKQTFAIARADHARQLSSEARLEGDQHLHIDVDLFVAWAGAYANHNERLTQFFYERLPPRFRTAMDAWIATKPAQNKDAPPHPFAMPEYRLEAHERAATLAKEADDELREGLRNNAISDTYVLFTVVLAMLILLASLGPRLHTRRPRRAMIVLSCLGLLITLVWLVLRPIGWIG